MAPSKARKKTGKDIPVAYLLLALGLLVFVVTMPRLREHVVHGNTLEASESLLLVGEFAYERGHGDLLALLRDEAFLRHRLRDARRSRGTGRLCHHGYLMDDTTLPDGQRAFSAWPIEYDRTGRDAWLVTQDGTLWRHANGGRWSGESRPLVRTDLRADGWGKAQ